jgi:hypothetical protein
VRIPNALSPIPTLGASLDKIARAQSASPDILSDKAQTPKLQNHKVLLPVLRREVGSSQLETCGAGRKRDEERENGKASGGTHRAKEAGEGEGGKRGGKEGRVRAQ